MMEGTHGQNRMIPHPFPQLHYQTRQNEKMPHCLELFRMFWVLFSHGLQRILLAEYWQTLLYVCFLYILYFLVYLGQLMSFPVRYTCMFVCVFIYACHIAI